MARTEEMMKLEPRFFGRQAELDELGELLQAGERLITVVAPGGYGKSRLVSELCGLLAADYPGGTCEVKLAAVGEPQRICRQAAEALGLQPDSDEDPRVRLLDYLREKRLLLHFDNFEHLLPGAPIIAELLAEAPDLQVIVTSREPLKLDRERLYRLDALPVSANGSRPGADSALSVAAEMFADRARLAGAGFALTPDSRAAVEDICRQLDGVPLALELAAAWADEYDLARIRSELREQLDLTARANDIPARHYSVRASCDWSYRLLDEYQQLVLRCISVFKGGFTLEQAAAVLPEKELPSALDMLSAKSWLSRRTHQDHVRYQMHDAAIREYAFQRLLKSDDYEVAVTIHCGLFAALLESQCAQLAGERQAEALRILGWDLENIYEALDSALHRGDPRAVLAFARNLHRYLLMVGSAKDCLAQYKLILDYCGDGGDRQVRYAANLGLADALVSIGGYKAARGNAVAARLLAIEDACPLDQACAEIVLGKAHEHEGDHAAARKHYSAGLRLMREADNAPGIARALRGLGRVEMVESEFAIARRLINECIELRRAGKDLFGIAACLNDLGDMAYREGDYEQARELQMESLQYRRQLGDLQGIAQSLNNLGNIEFSLSNFGEAWSLYDESLAIRREIGNRFGIAASLNNLGNVEYCNQNYDDARRLHVEGLELKRKIGDRIGVSFSLNNIANIDIKRMQFQTARQCLVEAIGIAVELHSKLCMLAPLAISASLLARLDRHRGAAILYFGALAQCEQTGLALDPMDGGMLEEAGRMVFAAVAATELDEIWSETQERSLEDLAQHALKVLAELPATG